MVRAWMLAAFTLGAIEAFAQEAPGRDADRGPGVPSSMFGTYIERGRD